MAIRVVAWSLLAFLLVSPLAGRSSPESNSKGMLLVIEKGAQSLAIVDPVAARAIASVPEHGVTGHEVAASPDGLLAYVPIYGDSRASGFPAAMDAHWLSSTWPRGRLPGPWTSGTACARTFR
jgi:hypothetical protein